MLVAAIVVDEEGAFVVVKPELFEYPVGDLLPLRRSQPSPSAADLPIW